MSVAFVLGISIATLVEVFRRDRIPQIGYALLAGSGAILGLIELQLRLENSAITPGLGSSLRMTIIDPLAAFSAALVLFGLFQGRFAVVARIARSQAIVTFASLAYAIYLFHYPILEILFARLLHDNSKLSTFAELTVLCALVVLPVAWVASRFVEQPFLAIKDRMRGDARAGYESASPVA
jgi:peptidoglycan/LPS O-acetylase OafA/YrhL